MSLDKYSTICFLTEEGWVEKPNFKGEEAEVIEEWSVSVFQASIKSIDVAWAQVGETSPQLKAFADKLRAKFPRPANSTF
jgi:hypothetical protein